MARMSDEPPPPPDLRLKLKPRPDQAAGAPPAKPGEPPDAPPTTDDPPPAPPESAADPPDAGAAGPGTAKIKLRMRVPIAPSEPPPAIAGNPEAPDAEAGAAGGEPSVPGTDKVRLRVRVPERIVTEAPPPEPSLPTLPPMSVSVSAPPEATTPVAPPTVATPKVQGDLLSRQLEPIGAGAASEPPLPTLPPLPVPPAAAPAAEEPRPEVSPGEPPSVPSLPPMPEDMVAPAAVSPAAPASREGAEVNPHLKLKSSTLLQDTEPAPAGAVRAAAPGGRQKTAKPRDSLGVFVRVTGLLLVLAVVYLVYRRYTQIPHPEKPETAAASRAQTPAKTASAPQTTPGRMVQKARETVAAGERGTAATNEVIGATATPRAAKPAPPPPPPPSPRFRAVVDRLKIAGFRAGPPVRLFVGGVTYQPGDVIDETLGIVFVGFDAKTRELIFQDGTGAEIRRQF